MSGGRGLPPAAHAFEHEKSSRRDRAQGWNFIVPPFVIPTKTARRPLEKEGR
jgi:hypothetical protein